MQETIKKHHILENKIIEIIDYIKKYYFDVADVCSRIKKLELDKSTQLDGLETICKDNIRSIENIKKINEITSSILGLEIEIKKFQNSLMEIQKNKEYIEMLEREIASGRFCVYPYIYLKNLSTFDELVTYSNMLSEKILDLEFLSGDANLITCSICLDFINMSEKILKCSHRFHEECINRWILQKSTCPQCRNPI